MNHKTDMHEALQLCIDAMLHDGVPTDPEHPKRIALNAAESALASRPDAQADERGAFEAWWQTTNLGERNQAWHGWKARAAAPQAARDQHEKSDLYKEGYLAGKAAAAAPSPDREQVGEDTRRVDELSMLIRQLVHALRKAAPDNDLADRAVNYLKRAGLQGSPLRVEAPDTSPSREYGERPVDPDDIDAAAEAIQRETSIPWEYASRAAVAAIDTLIARGNHARECGERQECPHDQDDGACGWCYDDKVASARTPTAPTQELAQNVLTESWVRRAQAAVNAVVGEKDEETLLKLAGRMEQLLREALEAAPAQREPVACGVCEPGECAAVDCGYPCITDQQRSNWAFLVNCWDEAQHGSPARAGAGAMAIDALRRLLAALQAAPVVAQPQVAEPKGLKEIAASFVDWELVERMRSAEEIDSEEAGMLGAMIDSQAREIEALRAILSKGA